MSKVVTYPTTVAAGANGTIRIHLKDKNGVTAQHVLEPFTAIGCITPHLYHATHTRQRCYRLPRRAIGHHHAHCIWDGQQGKRE
jgi:hypothetical protein